MAHLDMPKPQASNTERIQIREERPSLSQTDEDELREILGSCELHLFQRQTAGVFQHAVTRLFYAEQWWLDHSQLPRSVIRQTLHSLDGSILQAVERKLQENTQQQIQNTMAYTMTVILNEVWECEADLLLSEPQGFVLETLRQFNALRLDQIKWLLQTKYKDQYGVLNIRSVMRQLAYMGKVQAQENLWCALWRKPVPALIDAFDVMMLMCDDTVPQFRVEHDQCQLTFYLPGEAGVLCHWRTGNGCMRNSLYAAGSAWTHGPVHRFFSCSDRTALLQQTLFCRTERG